MENRDAAKDVIDLICDINNIFDNVRVSKIKKIIAGEVVEDVVFNRQNLIKTKLIKLLDNLLEKETSLNKGYVPYKLDPKAIKKDLKLV